MTTTSMACLLLPVPGPTPDLQHRLDGRLGNRIGCVLLDCPQAGQEGQTSSGEALMTGDPLVFSPLAPSRPSRNGVLTIAESEGCREREDYRRSGDVHPLSLGRPRVSDHAVAALASAYMDGGAFGKSGGQGTLCIEVEWLESL